MGYITGHLGGFNDCLKKITKHFPELRADIKKLKLESVDNLEVLEFLNKLEAFFEKIEKNEL